MSRTRRCQFCAREFDPRGGARTCSDDCQSKVDEVESRHWYLLIICDDGSHPTKVNTIDRFGLRAVRPEHVDVTEGVFDTPFGPVTFVGGNQWEVDDGTFRTGPEIFGTATKPPSGLQPIRARARLRCRLCGDHRELRHETARQLTVAKLTAGESTVRLAEISR